MKIRVKNPNVLCSVLEASWLNNFMISNINFTDEEDYSDKNLEVVELYRDLDNKKTIFSYLDENHIKAYVYIFYLSWTDYEVLE